MTGECAIDAISRAGVSVVIPVYGSEGTIRDVVRRVSDVLKTGRLPFEIILVNDCSPDGVWEVIGEIRAAYSNVSALNFMRNFGQHNALLAGIRHAQYDTIVTMDDDLQHPPECIPLLLEELDKGFDVVYGCQVAVSHGFFRDMASALTKLLLQQSMGVEAARSVSSFRAFRTNLREAFASYCSPYVFLDAMLTWGTSKFSVVPVKHEKRMVGKSGYTFRKLVLHMLNMITGFSVAPLHFASCVGIGTVVFGICVLIYILVDSLLFGRKVHGFAFLGCSLAIFSGVQLFALGVLGEYLARMHVRLMNRPSYVLKTGQQIQGDRLGSRERECKP